MIKLKKIHVKSTSLMKSLVKLNLYYLWDIYFFEKSCHNFTRMRRVRLWHRTIQIETLSPRPRERDCDKKFNKMLTFNRRDQNKSNLVSTHKKNIFFWHQMYANTIFLVIKNFIFFKSNVKKYKQKRFLNVPMLHIQK